MAVSALEAALIETWSLYAVGSIVIMLRAFSRTRMVGIAGWHPDDYMIFFAWVSSRLPQLVSKLTMTGLLHWYDCSSSYSWWYR